MRIEFTLIRFPLFGLVRDPRALSIVNNIFIVLQKCSTFDLPYHSRNVRYALSPRDKNIARSIKFSSPRDAISLAIRRPPLSSSFYFHTFYSPEERETDICFWLRLYLSVSNGFVSRIRVNLEFKAQGIYISRDPCVCLKSYRDMLDKIVRS